MELFAVFWLLLGIVVLESEEVALTSPVENGFERLPPSLSDESAENYAITVFNENHVGVEFIRFEKELLEGVAVLHRIKHEVPVEGAQVAREGIDDLRENVFSEDLRLCSVVWELFVDGEFLEGEFFRREPLLDLLLLFAELNFIEFGIEFFLFLVFLGLEVEPFVEFDPGFGEVEALLIAVEISLAEDELELFHDELAVVLVLGFRIKRELSVLLESDFDLEASPLLVNQGVLQAFQGIDVDIYEVFTVVVCPDIYKTYVVYFDNALEIGYQILLVVFIFFEKLVIGCAARLKDHLVFLHRE